MENQAVRIHDGLKHPVIDGDGHWIEPVSGLPGIFERSGRPWSGRSDSGRSGAGIRGGYRAHRGGSASTIAMRRTIWWGVTADTLDKATGLLPALLNERLPELGIDFAMIYPSFGLSVNGIQDDDLHRAGVRAYNMMDVGTCFAPYAERFRAGSHHPRPRPRRSPGGAGVRGGAARLQRGHAAGEPGAEDPWRGGGHRSTQGRLVLRQHRPGQPVWTTSPSGRGASSWAWP